MNRVRGHEGKAALLQEKYSRTQLQALRLSMGDFAETRSPSQGNLVP